MCQSWIISKYAYVEEDGRKYNTDGTDLTNAGPHSVLFSKQKNKALTCTSSKLLSQTGIDASEFLSYSNQISDLVWVCCLGVRLSSLAGRSSTLPWLCYKPSEKRSERLLCIRASVYMLIMILQKYLQKYFPQ